MPRFVLLRHDGLEQSGRPSHWDFMLETEPGLATWTLGDLPGPWRVALGPAAWGESLCAKDSTKVAAQQLALHRLAYLDFEGPLSDNRGRVRRCDGGEFQTLDKQEGVWEFVLHGALLRGYGQLGRQSDGFSEGAPEGEWLLDVGARS